MSDIVWGHVGLNCSDIKRSTVFYAEVFGFKVVSSTQIGGPRISRLMRMPASVKVNNTMLSKGDFRMELLQFVSPAELPWTQRYINEPGLSHLAFQLPSDQVERLCARVVSLGGALVPESVVSAASKRMPGARYVRDPDGQLIAFFLTHPKPGQTGELIWTHYGLGVTDAERSRAFYEQIFGFDRVQIQPLQSGHELALLMQLPEPVSLINYMLWRPNTQFRMEFLQTVEPGMWARRERVLNEPGLTHFAFYLPAALMPKIKEQVVARGGTLVLESELEVDPNDPSTRGRVGSLYVRDPDGQPIALFATQPGEPPLPR